MTIYRYQYLTNSIHISIQTDSGIEKYIGTANPLPFSSEIKQIDGSDVARNGQIPGLIDNPKLNKLA